jgi:phosphonopyruvate decarboxylase
MAVGVAAGHFLSTGEVALVYLQNSGLGNAVNPLISLMSRDVYGIPVVLLIGWRGQPGVPDEPQHLHQGRVTEEMLQLLDIPVERLTADTSDWEQVIASVVTTARERQGPAALLVSAGTFLAAPQRDGGEGAIDAITRPEAITIVLDTLPADTLYVATTGYTARELAAHRIARGESVDSDFLAVGSMGHASAIALGIAQGSPSPLVVCLDGDGAMAMHLGSLPTIGRASPANLGHILLNNGVHESVGGQPTVLGAARVVEIAMASGYRSAESCAERASYEAALNRVAGSEGPWMVEVLVGPGTLEGLPRPADFAQRRDQLRSRIDNG